MVSGIRALADFLRRWVIYEPELNTLICVCCVLSHVQLFVTPWTVARQAPLSMSVSRQEYTEELYKKELYNPDNHYGVITHLEPDILECKVKWALRTIIIKKKKEPSL